MSVLVRCERCGKDFACAESSLNQAMLCPLCGRATLARPLADNEPLSLDDAPEVSSPPSASNAPNAPDASHASNAPVVAPPSAAATQTPPVPTTTAAAVRSAIGGWLGSIALTVVLMFGVYAAFQYGSGEIAERHWREFTPPEGRCRIRLPGEPTEQPIRNDDPRIRTGKRYEVVRAWEAVTAGIAWIDVADDLSNDGSFEQWMFALRDRIQKQHDAELEREALWKLDRYSGRQFDYKTAKGNLYVRVLAIPDRSTSRIYTLWVGGKKLTPEMRAVKIFFASFRLNSSKE